MRVVNYEADLHQTAVISCLEANQRWKIETRPKFSAFGDPAKVFVDEVKEARNLIYMVMEKGTVVGVAMCQFLEHVTFLKQACSLPILPQDHQERIFALLVSHCADETKKRGFLEIRFPSFVARAERNAQLVRLNFQVIESHPVFQGEDLPWMVFSLKIQPLESAKKRRKQIQ
jgi:hypothetical protein